MNTYSNNSFFIYVNNNLIYLYIIFYCIIYLVTFKYQLKSGLEISENSRGSVRGGTDPPFIFWGGPQQNLENSGGPKILVIFYLLKHFNGVSPVSHVSELWLSGYPSLISPVFHVSLVIHVSKLALFRRANPII